MRPSDHIVQFYESDTVLVDSVSRYVCEGLESGESCIVIATPTHRDSLDRELTARGIDVAIATALGHYISLDAQETLSKFMIDDSPDPKRFDAAVGRVIADAAGAGRPIRAFGEIVALLWTNGNDVAAIQLEDLWNQVSNRYTFRLLCAYPMDGFGCDSHARHFAEICGHHSQVVPAESYTRLGGPSERLREIALLQQKARALEAEVARRIEATEALSRREQELADFLDNAVEGIHKVGPDGTILWANKAELELLGYRPEEYVGHHVAEFHVDTEVVEGMLGMLLAGETLLNYPARLRCKNGFIKDVLVHSNACFEDGKLVHTRCFTRDITERNLASIVQHRLAAIVEFSNDAIIGKTLEGIITSWNKGAERIFGYSALEAVGQPKTIVIPPDRLEEEMEILARLKRGERIDHFETVRQRKGGRLIDISLTISPIRDARGAIVGASTIARDISDTKQQQREVADLNDRLQRTIREMDHRVKNNLQIISAMIDLQTMEHCGSNGIPLDDFARLKSQVCAISLVHDRLTSETKDPERIQRMSTKAVLEQLMSMLQQTAWKQEVRYEIADTEISSKQCISLALVINELVFNAMKHGNGQTEAAFRIDARQAILEVWDNGAGFARDFDAARSANTGLELVESLVHTDLSGEIHYENRPDGGARVRVSFPLPRIEL